VLPILGAGGPAAAAPKPISGKLDRPGYTVLALAADGSATAVEAKRGKFKLRPPANRVSLHLRAPSGTYAGPVVAASTSRGRRAIVGIRAGARLARVKVRAGYAKLAKKLSKRSIDAGQKARARKGVPIGARRFGRVRSRLPKRPVPGDADVDGIPDPLDIDDDGDLILDDLDPRKRDRPTAEASQVIDNAVTTPFLHFFLFQSVHANPRLAGDPSTPAFSDQQIDEALVGRGPPLGPGLTLSMGIPFGGSSTELDCGRDNPGTPELEGLSYCRPGGTGIAAFAPQSNKEFPECCDPDGDGFGTMVSPPNVPPGAGAAMEINPGATSVDMKTGQQLIKRINDANGVEIGSVTTTLQSVVATVPALASYRDTTMAAPTAVPYPSAGGELPISASSGQDLVMTLSVWRPQRRRIVNDPAPQGEASGTWIDIGGLFYGVKVDGTGSPGPGGQCPQSAFSEDDPNLAPPLSPLAGGGLIDTVVDPVDRPASPANTLTFTVNLSQCDPVPWQVGQTRFVSIGVSTPTGGPAFASQAVPFKRQ
jgi:hypothetical protein